MSPSQLKWSYARTQALRGLDSLILADVAVEASESLLAALKDGRPELVGRVFLAAFNAHLDATADWSMGIETTADEESAARCVLLEQSVQDARSELASY